MYLHLWNFCPSRDSTFPFLFHGSCTIPSLNLFPQLSRVDVCHRHFRELQTCTNHVLKHLQVLGRFTFPLSHSFPRGTDVTANPLSKCAGLMVSCFVRWFCLSILDQLFGLHKFMCGLWHTPFCRNWWKNGFARAQSTLSYTALKKSSAIYYCGTTARHGCLPCSRVVFAADQIDESYVGVWIGHLVTKHAYIHTHIYVV